MASGNLRRLAAGVLLGTCLTPIAALAAGDDGGNGGTGAGAVGGSGGSGASPDGGSGGTGGNTNTAGASGAGTWPGQGGNGIAGGGGGLFGGVGGTATGAGAGGGGGGGAGSGGGGGAGAAVAAGGGGGGGGGSDLQVGAAFTITGTFVGGAGGLGGAGASGFAGSDGGGGGGGGGGSGVIVSAGVPITNNGTVTGGVGGAGGTGGGGGAFAGGGGGGAGGSGFQFNSGGSLLTNTASVTGGTGGGGSDGGFGGAGVFVEGTGSTVNNGAGASITGGNGAVASADNGGVGGHGVFFFAAGSANTVNNGAGATIAGGNGGLGGSGFGGFGGHGVASVGSVTVVNGVGATIAGGNGASAVAGNGGFGGVAVVLFGGGTVTNLGTIRAGNGAPGTGGGVDGFANPGIAGAGLTVINGGSIIGGLGGDGVTRSAAIHFTGGTNVLELQNDPSNLTGNVIAVVGGTDTLRLGGSGSQSFATAQLDPAGQFQNFSLFEKTGTGTWTLTGTPGQATPWTITQGTLAISSDLNLGTAGETLTFNGGALQLASGFIGGLNRPIVLNAGGGTLDTNGNSLTLSTIITGTGGLTKNGAGILNFQVAQAYTGGTTINAGTLFLDSVGGSLPTGGALTVNGGLFDMSDAGAGQSVGALAGAGGQINLGANNLTANSPANTTLATQIIGTGALIKQGTGILTMTGTSSYSGGTTVEGGLINFSALNNFGTGNITLNGGGLQWATGNTLDISSQLNALGPGGGTFDTNGNNVSLATAITGAGSLTKQGLGTLTLTGTNSYAGPTMVTAGTLAVNGSVTSNTTVAAAGTLGGTGTIFGGVNMQGTIAPGNSIGTLTVTGSFTQAAGGIYQVEVNAAGQGDRINVTGAPGTATINGGTVQVIAAVGSYANSTTYTILNATGGRTGTYSGVTSNFAFLTPTLSYDPNNVFLTLALLEGPTSGFLMSAFTPNQKAVGAALNQSFAGASGDFATVIGALAGLSAFQGPAALNAISGEQYADFGTMNTNNAAMFMNAIGQQMAIARSGAAAPGQRASLAQACDVAACDGVSPFSVWGSALGGVGSVNGDTNASTATYNFGGAAVGIDYRLDPRFLVGLAASYTSGNLWVNGFPGKGWSNNVGVAAYGSFTQDGFYADLLGGYAYYGNQLQRQITISGLQRTAWGSTGANQALGQVETGYRFGIYAPAGATLAPFARLQGSSVTQNGFTESGAQSLNLNVAQQTTNSLRTLFGLDLAGAVPLGADRTLDLGLRLGWQHEFASTQRPITAALGGAPFAGFTVYGATPQPDSAVISFRANTRIAEQTQVYLRYDGDIGSGTDNHALNLGVRISW